MAINFLNPRDVVTSVVLILFITYSLWAISLPIEAVHDLYVIKTKYKSRKEEKCESGG